MNPTRILFAIPELGSGGPDRVFHELVCGLDRASFLPMLLVSHAGGQYFEALPADIETCDIGGGRYPVWRFARAVDRLRPDLILTTLRMNPTAAAARALQFHRPPLIARQANAIGASFLERKKNSQLKYGFAEWVVTRLLRVPEVLIAQSSEMGAELARHALARQRIAVIGNPISLPDIDSACNRQRMGIESESRGSPHLIAVGRLTGQKGFDLLISAFAEFIQDFPPATLKILGEGPDRTILQEQIRSLGLDDAVNLPGASRNVLAEVEAADIFVSSSRYEGFSNAMLEAMVLARTVVATNCEGATKDLILDGKTGILVNSVDAPALAEGMRRAMAMDRSILGGNARRHVERNFERTHIVRQYSDLFEALLSS